VAAPCPISFPSIGLAVAEAEPPAEAAELVQLGAREPAHLVHEPRHVAGEDVRDQPPAGHGQAHADEPAIVLPPRLVDQAAPHQVADDHGGVAVGAQQLLAEVPLAEGPVVQQRLQHAELADREPDRGHHPAHPGGDGLGGPHQLDVGVEGRRLGRGAGVARRHWFKFERFVSLGRGVVKRGDGAEGVPARAGTPRERSG
jgi:hypothetical protein